MCASAGCSCGRRNRARMCACVLGEREEKECSRFEEHHLRGVTVKPRQAGGLCASKDDQFLLVAVRLFHASGGHETAGLTLVACWQAVYIPSFFWLASVGIRRCLAMSRAEMALLENEIIFNWSLRKGGRQEHFPKITNEGCPRTMDVNVRRPCRAGFRCASPARRTGDWGPPVKYILPRGSHRPRTTQSDRIGRVHCKIKYIYIYPEVTLVSMLVLTKRPPPNKVQTPPTPTPFTFASSPFPGALLVTTSSTEKSCQADDLQGKNDHLAVNLPAVLIQFVNHFSSTRHRTGVKTTIIPTAR